jgi:hypothetical protein
MPGNAVLLFMQQYNNKMKEVPVAQHAASHGVSDLDKCFTLKILKSVTGPTGYAGLRQWELSYQNILKSKVAPRLPGLNIC